MKKYISILPLITLISCGNPTQDNNNGTADTATAAVGPYAVLCRNSADTVQLNGQKYLVDIMCQADTSAVVRDALDTEFYDNAITLRLTKEGQEIFTHTFSKSEFSGHYEASKNILQGIAYSHTEGGRIILGAVVGEPANDEGGINYRIIVDTGGTYSITADYTQDSTHDGEE